MDLTIRWKRVFLIAVPGAIAINLAYLWAVPKVSCVDHLEDLHQLASKNLAKGNTDPITVDAYYIKETQRWCYIE